MQKTVGDELQIIGKDNYDAMFRSYGEMNKGFQAIFARWVEFSKRSFEDATRTWEKLIAVKSLDQAFEIQTNYAKNAVFVHRTRRLQAGREDDGKAQGLSYRPAHPFGKDPALPGSFLLVMPPRLAAQLR